jgi:hypothetical protein
MSTDSRKFVYPQLSFSDFKRPVHTHQNDLTNCDLRSLSIYMGKEAAGRQKRIYCI